MIQASSTPSFTEFDPDIIPYQREVIRTIRDYDYEQGILEVLLSGSVGSAKSILMAHIALYHVVTNAGARLLLGRKALPDLKDTIFQKVLEHIEGSPLEAYVRSVNHTSPKIQFINGSEIISRSWSDKKYKKMRSLELSAAIFEELTENNQDDAQAYMETKMRIGRLPHIKTNFFLSATNPDSPSHWVYKHFIEPDMPSRKVFYSVTTDNPFLPPQYIQQLKDELDPKLARRMIYGEWLEIASEVVYHAYDKEVNFRNKDYEVDTFYPIHVAWDFNIGEGKPLSCCLFQYIDDTFHVFDEVVVEGMRTLDSCEELATRGLLDYRTKYIINGDASGKNRDTRSIKSDYDIINMYFSKYKTPSDEQDDEGRSLNFEMAVPRANPPVRRRHNLMNAYCLNENGDRRLFVYKKAKTVDEGLRLTALKKGGNYVEDDSKHFQHITTALGYGLVRTVSKKLRGRSTTREI